MLTRITKISAAWAMALAVAGCQAPNAYAANNDTVEAHIYYYRTMEHGGDYIVELTVDYHSSNRIRMGDGLISKNYIAVPKKRPTNSTIDIQWTIDPYPNAKIPRDPPYDPARARAGEYKVYKPSPSTLAYKKKEDQEITYRRSIPYPDYQEVGDFSVFFLPCNEVRIVIDKQENEALRANFSPEAVLKKLGVKKCPKL
jgi:hypothetical protein